MFTPDGRQAISTSRDKTAKVWDIKTGKEQLSLMMPWADCYMDAGALAVTPDGQRVVLAWSDIPYVYAHGGIGIWNIEKGEVLWSELDDMHDGRVNAVAITPDGQRAISASGDNTLKVWDIDSGEKLHTLFGHSSEVDVITITPDGQHLVSGSRDNTLKLWGLESGDEILTLRGHSDRIYAVDISPDGHHLLSVSADQTLLVWDIKSGKIIASFYGDSEISACAVLPDGFNFIAGDASGGIYLLQLKEK